MKSFLSPVYSKKSKEALTLALPIIAGQVGQVMMGFFDTVQIGGLGHEYIAGSGFASNLFWIVNLLGLGVLFAISTLVSEAFGEKSPWKVIGIYRSGIKITWVMSVIFSLLTAVVVRYIHIFGQDEIVSRIATRYLQIIIYSIPLMFIFSASKQLLDGMGRTKIAMYVTLGGLIINVFFNWVLIYGKLGFPPLEIEGAAIATIITRALMVLAMLLIIWRDKQLRQLRKTYFASPLKNKSYVPDILRIGIPAGLQFFLEVAAFGAAQVMSGWLGIIEEAAHQIAIGLASITFMALTGISAAGNIITGYSFGAKDREGIRISGITVLGMTLMVEIVFALIFLLLHPWLPMLYTDNPVVLSLASSMVLLAALFQISDGLQASAVGILRGMQDVSIPALLAFFSYWGVMIPCCYLLAFYFGLGLSGIWIGFIIGLSIAAIVLLIRFKIMVKKVKFNE